MELGEELAGLLKKIGAKQDKRWAAQLEDTVTRFTLKLRQQNETIEHLKGVIVQTTEERLEWEAAARKWGVWYCGLPRIVVLWLRLAKRRPPVVGNGR